MKQGSEVSNTPRGLQVLRCTVVAVSDDMPYVLAASASGDQFMLNKKVSGPMWKCFAVGLQIDVHTICDAPRPSKILAVYPASDAEV